MSDSSAKIENILKRLSLVESRFGDVYSRTDALATSQLFMLTLRRYSEAFAGLEVRIAKIEGLYATQSWSRQMFPSVVTQPDYNGMTLENNGVSVALISMPLVQQWFAEQSARIVAADNNLAATKLDIGNFNLRMETTGASLQYDMAQIIAQIREAERLAEMYVSDLRVDVEATYVRKSAPQNYVSWLELRDRLQYFVQSSRRNTKLYPKGPYFASPYLTFIQDTGMTATNCNISFMLRSDANAAISADNPGQDPFHNN